MPVHSNVKLALFSSYVQYATLSGQYRTRNILPTPYRMNGTEYLTALIKIELKQGDGSLKQGTGSLFYMNVEQRTVPVYYYYYSSSTAPVFKA